MDLRTPVVPIMAGSRSSFDLLVLLLENEEWEVSLMIYVAYLLHISHVEVEGTRGVDDGLEGRVRDDGLVESIFLSDVFYDGEVELVFAVAGVGFCDLVGFFLGADGCDDAVALLQQVFEDVGGDDCDLLLVGGSGWRNYCLIGLTYSRSRR